MTLYPGQSACELQQKEAAACIRSALEHELEARREPSHGLWETLEEVVDFPKHRPEKASSGLADCLRPRPIY